MPWTKPKTDWNPGDGITATDLNRIEDNTYTLFDSVYNMNGYKITPTDLNNEYIIGGTAVVMTPTHKLVLSQIGMIFNRWYHGEVDIKIGIKRFDGNGNALDTSAQYTTVGTVESFHQTGAYGGVFFDRPFMTLIEPSGGNTMIHVYVELVVSFRDYDYTDPNVETVFDVRLLLN
jgi:hypothetical protein